MLAATSGLVAAPPGFDAWWASMTAGGASGPDVDGVEIRYEVAWLEVPTPEEMAAMRARVAGRPEHPDHARLAAAERRMRKADVAECRLWRLDGQWRYAVTYPDSPVGYIDCVWSRKSAWRLSPGQLHLFSLNPKDERTREVVRMSSNFSYESTLLLNGGLSGPVGSGLDLRPTLVGADRWELHAATPTPEGSAGESGQRIRVRASGRWDGAAGVGTVDRVVLEGLNDAGEVSDAEVMTAEGWTTLPGSTLQVARQVRVDGEDGRPVKRITLVSSTRFSPRSSSG